MCAVLANLGSNTIRAIGLNFDIAGYRHQDSDGDSDEKSNITYLTRPRRSLIWP